MKQKKNKKESALNPTFKGVSDSVVAECEEIASRIANSERAMNLLRKEIEEDRKKLTEIMSSYKIPFINVEIKIKNITEKYNTTLVSQRGFIPVELGLKKIIYRWLKEPDLSEASRNTKNDAKRMANVLSSYLRKDSLLISVLEKKEWAKKLIENKSIQPYVMVEEGHKKL